MALIRDFDLPGGITVPNAYFVITNLVATKKLLDITPAIPGSPGMPAGVDPETGDPTPEIPAVPDTPEVRTLSQKWNCKLIVSVFKDKATREAGGTPVAAVPDTTGTGPFITDFEYDPTGPLSVVQGYLMLMAQPYFTGAIVDAAS